LQQLKHWPLSLLAQQRSTQLRPIFQLPASAKTSDCKLNMHVQKEKINEHDRLFYLDKNTVIGAMSG
jgi:hypothetical protein